MQGGEGVKKMRALMFIHRVKNVDASKGSSYNLFQRLVT